MKHFFINYFIFFLFFLSCFSVISASELQLEVSGISSSGLVVQNINLDPAIRWLKLDPQTVRGIEIRYGNIVIPNQIIVGNNFTQLVAQFPDELVRRSQSETLVCELTLLTGEISATEMMHEITAETSEYRIRHSVKSQGGMPSRIEFIKTGRVLETHHWMDRLPHGFNVKKSSDVRLTLLADNSFVRIIRNEVLLNGDRLPKEKAPRIAYTWYYFKQQPGLIFVTADYSQPEPLEWKELHFLELHVPDGSFSEYFDLKYPKGKTKFKNSKKINNFTGAAILNGENRIAMFGYGQVSVYDSLHEFGPYLLGNGYHAWGTWNETTKHLATWLRIDTGASEPIDLERRAYVRLTIPILDQTATTWIDVAKNSLFYTGIFKTKKELDEFKTDGIRFYKISSKNLGMLLEKTVTENDSGIRLVALVDIPTRTLLTPHEPQSLFTVTLREKQSGKSDFLLRYLESDHHWKSVDIVQNSDELQLTFTGIPNLPDGETVRLTLSIKSHYMVTSKTWYEQSSISITWKENVTLPPNLTLQSAALPQIRLAAWNSEMKGFYPQASGIVVDRLFDRKISWKRPYPHGWASMPWFTIWNNAKEKSKQVGVYVAAHDINGTTKEQSFSTDLSTGTIQIDMKYPAENLGKTNSKLAPCQIVLESYHGDWFDAAVMYRNWVRREALWYPRTKITEEGRTDTPLWMRELPVWCQLMFDETPIFQAQLGVPTGVHWYGWHEIPFDNDYPHFFPAKPYFRENVMNFQKGGKMFMMPYINGRLWDKRDRGSEDWLFTKEALPGVTKKEDGSIWTEICGSKESDGSNSELGVMCPASDVWQRKIRELVFRLTNTRGGVKAVYIDQVAAMQPVHCFDPLHGHPLGGGDWWVQSYKKMFETIRAEMPKDTALTTECNAEPYLNLFDGYLTWHFQDDGQVPAFATVYGGAIQMFGRYYEVGIDYVLATKMKLAESFVFGEQLGWMSPLIINKPEEFEYLKKLVTLRYKFREFFYKGEMARPPKLYGNLPQITVDWHFKQPTIVTTDIIRTGVWWIPAQKTAILLFANFSDQTVENKLEFDLAELGFDPKKVTVVRYNTDGVETKLSSFPESLRFNAEEVFVLKIKQ
ncbi:MAG: DUF6259 domain-containing protein [Planctomycetaceae bacterium]|jgi:hypothetical protein|nr:DUF6259 domain-containing protein [Planctomycetaceae bacterium]